MAGKKKTTFTKMARESKLRERRLEKQAKKDARKHAGSIEQPPAGELPASDELSGMDELSAGEAPRASDATEIGAV